jgi:hypothetical protein
MTRRKNRAGENRRHGSGTEALLGAPQTLSNGRLSRCEQISVEAEEVAVLAAEVGELGGARGRVM